MQQTFRHPSIPAHETNSLVILPVSQTPQATPVDLDAANTFTDAEGETYEARIEDGDVIALIGQTDHEHYIVRFFKADALKIIALIAEAAK